MKNPDLKKRILQVSWKHHLSHLSSCLTAVDIVNEIFKVKGDSPFILSNGHAGLALYVCLEKYRRTKTADEIFNHHGVHPDRCPECGIEASAGSLGQGLPIALGMAMADRAKNVYCLISDGECAEGSIWEALRIMADQKVENLKVYVNMNGYSAYDPIDILDLRTRLEQFSTPANPLTLYHTDVDDFPFLKGVDGHYYTMNEGDYHLAVKSCV